MNSIINNYLMSLNNIGRVFWQYSARVCIQSSVLIILLLIIDFILRRHVRAVFRYCVWLLVFLKLVLPPSFSLPTGISYWWSGLSSIETPIVQQVPNVVQYEPTQPSSAEFSSTLSLPRESAKVVQTEVVRPAVLTEPAVRASVPLTWQAILFILWLIGILVFSVLLIQRVFFVRGLIAQCEPAKDRLVKILNQCRWQIGISRSVELKLSPNIQSPAVCGLLRPTVLMPKALFEKLSPEKLRAVLIHELAHIKRGDLWINLAQTLLQIVYFYNPFVWLTNAIVRRIREQAVDEMVLVALGAEAKSYSNTLIDIAEMAFWKANFSLRLIGVVESKKALHGRIKHMLTRPIPKSAKIGVIGVLAVFVIGALLLPMAAAKTEKNESLQFVANLPDNITLELVGVCEHPSSGEKWWQPDGSFISNIPYETTGGGVDVSQEGYAEYEFVARVVGSSDYDMKWSVLNSTKSTYTGHPLDKDAKRVLDLEVYTANQPKERDAITIRIGIAFGPWDIMMSIRTLSEATMSIDDIEVGFGTPYEKDGHSYIPVSYLRSDFENRAVTLFAVDNKGKEYRGGYTGSGGNKLHIQTYRFPFKLKDIRQFIFKGRPYQWVTFNNVSLRPGVKTDVQVEIEEASEVSDGDKMASENLTAQGWELWQQRKLVEAEKIFEKAVLKNQKNANAWNGLGWSQQNQGKFLNAKLSFEKCLQIQPEHAAALNGSGWIAKAQGKTDEAIAHWKKAIEAVPTATAALNGLATTYMELKDYGKAEMYYEMWLNVEPDNSDVRAGLERAKLAKTDVRAERKKRPNSILPKEIQPSEGVLSGRFEPVDSQTKELLLTHMEGVSDMAMQAFNAGDIDTTLSYYTDDAISLPDQHEAAIGKGALHKLFMTEAEKQVKLRSIKVKEQQVWICGEMIYEAGKYTISFTAPGTRFLFTDYRKSLTVYERQPDGSLKIKLDSWNPDVIPTANVTANLADPIVTAIACGTSAVDTTESNMEAVYDQIKQKELTFHKAFIEHNAEAAAQFYANDAIIMSWGKNAVRGKADIFSDIKKSMSVEPLVDMTQHVVHIEGNGQMLFVVNLFSWKFKDKSSGENVTLPGKGVHVWKRQQDSSWKILLDLYNVSVPLPEK